MKRRRKTRSDRFPLTLRPHGIICACQELLARPGQKTNRRFHNARIKLFLPRLGGAALQIFEIGPAESAPEYVKVKINILTPGRLKRIEKI